MPTNLYGPGDHYDLQKCHVLPALIRKFHEAKVRDDDTVTVWGSGRPRREFLYSDDMADACIHLLTITDERLERHLGEDLPPFVNAGCGENVIISELCQQIRDVIGVQAKIVYDSSKPDGTPRKLLDVSLMKTLGWQARTPFGSGLRSTYNDFVTAEHKSSVPAKMT